MVDIDAALDAVLVGLLAGAFALFLARSLAGKSSGPKGAADFGLVFAAFLAAWLATELFEIVAPESIQETGEIVHFLLLASFALWLVVRWQWVLRRAREGA